MTILVFESIGVALNRLSTVLYDCDAIRLGKVLVAAAWTRNHRVDVEFACCQVRAGGWAGRI